MMDPRWTSVEKELPKIVENCYKACCLIRVSTNGGEHFYVEIADFSIQIFKIRDDKSIKCGVWQDREQKALYVSQMDLKMLDESKDEDVYDNGFVTHWMPLPEIDFE